MGGKKTREKGYFKYTHNRQSVSPLRSLALRSAPLRTSSCTTLTIPERAAMCRGLGDRQTDRQTHKDTRFRLASTHVHIRSVSAILAEMHTCLFSCNESACTSNTVCDLGDVSSTAFPLKPRQVPASYTNFCCFCCFFFSVVLFEIMYSMHIKSSCHCSSCPGLLNCYHR